MRPPLLAERYELLGVLGEGAMGRVYRVGDTAAGDPGVVPRGAAAGTAMALMLVLPWGYGFWLACQPA